MIAALIAIMLTLSQGGDPCALGMPIDWYAWTRTTEAQTARVAVTYHADGIDFLLYEATDEVVLFVFRPAEERVGSIWHGRCAQTFPR